jgi:hypothetical protein
MDWARWPPNGPQRLDRAARADWVADADEPAFIRRWPPEAIWGVKGSQLVKSDLFGRCPPCSLGSSTGLRAPGRRPSSSLSAFRTYEIGSSGREQPI